MNECMETPKGRECFICGQMGSWDRPVVDIDDWYPKPCPPEPLHDETSWFAFILFMVLFILVCYGLGNLIATGNIF